MYVLKRITGSVLDQKNSYCLLLDSVITRIGRHTLNDYCLESFDQPCLISRWHTQIHRVTPDQFTIIDSSVNGTYVNNTRVSGTHELRHGDVITFGYFGGHSVKPGQRVIPDIKPEFSFTFIKVDDMRQCRLKPKNNPISESEKTSTPSSAVAYINNKHVPPNIHVPQDIRSNGVAERNNPTSPLDLRCGGPISSQNANDSESTEIFRRSIKQAEKFGQSDSELEEFKFDVFGSDKKKSNPSLNGITKSGNAARNCKVQPISSTDSTREYSEATISSSSSSTSSAESNSSLDMTSKRSQVKTKSIPDNKARNNKSVSSVKTSSTQEQVCSDENVQPQRRGRRKARTLSADAKINETTSAAQKSNNNKNNKRKSEDNQPVSKRGKRKSASKKDMFHSDGDICAAYNCSRPVAKKVSWVQCDDCDDWFHVGCIDNSGDLNKFENTDFHCGCA